MKNKSILYSILLFLISCQSKIEYTAKFDRYSNHISYYKSTEDIKYISNYEGSYKNPDLGKAKKSKKFYLQDESIADKKHGYTGYYKVGKPYKIKGITYRPRKDPNYKEIGEASWYGEQFYGKKTANGEIYDMHDMTAAHRTLPLPSVVKVTNLENGKSVKVRINDRGPFAKNRIIDVSKKAATILGFHNQGVTKVKVEFLKKDTEEMLKYYGLK